MSDRPVCYFALSPEFEVYGQTEVDSAEHGRDLLWIFAASQRRARILALRGFRRLARLRSHNKYGARRWNPDDDGIAHPMRGLVVRRLALSARGLEMQDGKAGASR